MIMKTKKRKDDKMVKDTIETTSNNPYGIKTPTNVEEFRNNLKKYFMTIRSKDNYEGLYVMGYNRGIDINELNCLDDLYRHDRNPHIIPQVKLVKDLVEYMNEQEGLCNTSDYFYDEKNYKVYTNQLKFNRKVDWLWYGIDNPILQEFYYLTLGEFCGYELKENN